MKSLIFLLNLAILMTSSAKSIYEHDLKSIDGESTTLAEHKGKVILMVNVASRCGFTRQYKGLEELYDKYKNKGLVVCGFPCNQFGRQEPGSGPEILEFCQRRYEVTFQMCAKIHVNGKKVHPLFRQLKKARRGFFGTQRIAWNFTKFLVGRQGDVLARYGSRHSPSSLVKLVEQALEA